MAERSLKTSQAGILRAENALTDKGWSRQDLADRVVIEGKKTTTGISIQTIHKFLTGEKVDRKYFVGICRILNLPWDYVHGRADKFYDEIAGCMRDVDALRHTLDCALKYAYELAPNKRDDFLINELEPDFNFELAQPIKQLKDELSDCLYNSRFVDWWQTKGQAWTEQLRAITIEYRNIGYDWQFSDVQILSLVEEYALTLEDEE